MMNCAWTSPSCSGCSPPCSSSSTGSCCWRTPSCRRSARSAPRRTRWRRRWAYRTPAAWAAGPSRAARRTRYLSPSSVRRGMWQNGTGKNTHRLVEVKTKGECFKAKIKKNWRVFYQLKEADPYRWLVLFSLISVWKKSQSVFYWDGKLSRDKLSRDKLSRDKLSSVSIFYSLLIVLWSCHGPERKKREHTVNR